MTESENKKKIDWIRGSKKADLSEVNLRKIQKAHEERGLNVEVDADHPENTTITKTVIKGLPATEEKA